MKYISFAIPCYNSAAYMDRAVESILKGGEDVEIIIVNDGSKDDTSKIAHEYEEKYPTIVRAVDKENGGHGDAVNAGLDHAEGKYFKVVDSDDWVDEEALYKILDVLKKFEEEEKQVDMLLANYVYEKEGMEHKKVIEYKNVLPQEEIFGWNDVKHFHLGQYILMHSVIYRTDFLKLCQLRLPKHTFYVDNIYVYYPLPHVRKMYYMDVDFYRYYIGREDQSVNEKVMISRVDQQIFVTKSMIDMYDMRKISNKKLRVYLSCNYDDGVFDSSDSFQKCRESGKETGAVAVSEEESLRNLLEDPLRNPWTDHESSGQIRKKDFVSGVHCGEKNCRI